MGTRTWLSILASIGGGGSAGTLLLQLHRGGQWVGVLRFDRPRHCDWLKLPSDYPRSNPSSECFVVEAESLVRTDEGSPRLGSGQALQSFPLQLNPDETVRLAMRRKESP